MNLKPKHLHLIKLGVIFIIPFIALSILVPKYFAVEPSQTLTGLFALTALGLVGIVKMYHWQGHQGNSPMFLGGAILLLAGVPLLTSISVQGSTPLIELESRTQGFAFIGLAVGFIIFLSGFKLAMSNSYFLGRGGSK